MVGVWMNRKYNTLTLAIFVSILFLLGTSISIAQESDAIIKKPSKATGRTTQRLPDIILTGFALEKNGSFVGQAIAGNFTTDILNKNFAGFHGLLSVNGSNYNETIFINGSGTYNPTPLNFSTPGAYSITLFLDYNNTIMESNENNNKISLEINVTSIPLNVITYEPVVIQDIVVKDFDLAKTEISSNESLGGWFELEIANSTDLTADIVLSVDNSDYKEDINVTAGVYNFTPILFSAPGFYTISIIADPRNKINETNETNNFLSAEIKVNDAPQSSTTETGQAGPEDLDRNFTLNIDDAPRPASRTYVYANGMLIQSIDEDGSGLYYHQDAQKNIRLVTDGNGNLVQENYFEPFGNLISFTSMVFNKILFSQKEKDDSGLSYFGARYYDSLIGRWLSPDPIPNPAESGYIYVKNNPLIYHDPDGRKHKLNSQIEEPNHFQLDPVHGSTELRNPPRANPSGYAAGKGAHGFAVLIETIRQFQESSNVKHEMDIHNNLVWNSFWNRYGVRGKPSLPTNKPGYYDIFGPWIKSILPEERVDVGMGDVEHVMTQIKTQEELDEFLRTVGFELNEEGQFYFKAFKLVLHDEQVQMLVEADMRTRGKKSDHIYQEQRYKDSYPIASGEFEPAKRDELMRPAP